ncbi:MAG: Lipoprotein [Candidatus Daviesbacteria bacterium GW2011_GWA2_38_24]|uniref:Lipoprotein n=1 Tax=Candidatus Daviesbacteria bacterium GW2011_GWA2_38_24 TaxID=1618422 RepID=A0A0G0JIW9_9BACT|nr:MAG: Lipoprotein [Candidatus Daviesbacteria bacterium GW2011_GWA2_38_24]
MNSTSDDLKQFCSFLVRYNASKTQKLGHKVEGFKEASLSVLMHRRGRFQKHVWHTSMISLAAAGVLTSGVMGGTSIMASSFPGMGDQDPRFIETFDPFASGISLDSIVNINTNESSKPRSEIIEYEVKSGDTMSSIAEKHGVAVNTIKWANNLENINFVKPGQTLKILPVSGVAHTVKSGDNLESVAKKYSVDSQVIITWPFNDIADDFKLTIGQVLIIPDGTPPETKLPVQKPRPQPQYLAQGPSSPVFDAPSGGGFVWPTVSAGISQYFAWYHPGIDIPNPSAPPIVASDGGVVLVAGWPDNYGYGNRVVVDHGNGYQTLYAHMSNIYVSTGQKVTRGQTVGRMGSTGRSTGTHLHFEIRFKGRALNPLAILK